MAQVPDGAGAVECLSEVGVDRRPGDWLQPLELPGGADVDRLDEVECDGDGDDDDAEERHDANDQDDGAQEVCEGAQPLCG